MPAGDPIVDLKFTRRPTKEFPNGQYLASVYFPPQPGDPEFDETGRAVPPHRERHQLATDVLSTAQTRFDRFVAEVLPGILEEHERRRFSTEPLNPHDPTAAAFIAAWQTWAEHNLEPATVQTARIAWDAFVRLVPVARVRDISRAHIEQFKRRRLEDTYGKDAPRTVQPRTVNNNLKDLKAIFNRAIAEGFYTGQNPFTRIERFRVTRRQPQFHSEDQLEKLLFEASLRPPLDWLVMLCALAGLRKKEALHARWEWFRFEGAQPTIHLQSGHGLELKDHEERIVAMSNRLRRALQPHRKPEGFVLVSPAADRSNGRHTYRYDPKRALETALKDAGLPTDRAYQRLRVTFACLHLLAGTPLDAVAGWMGHTDINVTWNYYLAARAYSTHINNVGAPAHKKKAPRRPSRRGVNKKNVRR